MTKCKKCGRETSNGDLCPKCKMQRGQDDGFWTTLGGVMLATGFFVYKNAKTVAKVASKIIFKA